MDRTLAACRVCESAVPAEAVTCHDCGYAVESHDRWRLLLGGLGTVLSLSVVFTPLGLPLLWRAHCHRLAADGSVADRRQSQLREHLTDVLHQHLGRSG